MKLAIVGSRSFDNERLAYKLLDVTAKHLGVDLVVSGGAHGADMIGEAWARSRGIAVQIHKPDWDRHGKSAGFIRNADIVHDADIVFALWDGKSRGTLDTLRKAETSDKMRIVILPEGTESILSSDGMTLVVRIHK